MEEIMSKELLYTIFVTCLVISNVVTGRLIQTGFHISDVAVVIPGGLLCYAITYLVTDVISEMYGKESAIKAVNHGFICQIIASILILLTGLFPAQSNEINEAYKRMLGLNFLFAIASLTSYYASQKLDVYVFHKIRNRLSKTANFKKYRGIWNTASTSVSQLADTVLYLGIAFGLGMGWLWNPSMRKILFISMLGQYIAKILIAVLDTPLFYILTSKKN